MTAEVSTAAVDPAHTALYARLPAIDCQPEWWLTAEEAAALVDEVITLSRGRLASGWLGWLGWRQTIALAPDAAQPPEPVA